MSSQETLTLKDYLSMIRFSRAYGVFYAVVVGLSVVLLLLTALWPSPHPWWLIGLEGVLTVVFVAEVTLQLLVQRANYFRAHCFNKVEFLLCLASVVAYVEVLAQFHMKGPGAYESMDAIMIFLRYVARGGRLLFFLRQRTWHHHNTHHFVLVDPSPKKLSGGPPCPHPLPP
eukprot:RCo027515